MDKYSGKKYVLTNSENAEEYMTFIGIPYFARKVALNLKQTIRLTDNGDGTYTFDSISTMASSTNTFTSGVEFDEVRPDGAKRKSTVTIEGNIMTHFHTESDGKISKTVREFYEDKVIATTTIEGFDKAMIRHYVLEED